MVFGRMAWNPYYKMSNIVYGYKDNLLTCLVYGQALASPGTGG